MKSNTAKFVAPIALAALLVSGCGEMVDEPASAVDGVDTQAHTVVTPVVDETGLSLGEVSTTEVGDGFEAVRLESIGAVSEEGIVDVELGLVPASVETDRALMQTIGGSEEWSDDNDGDPMPLPTVPERLPDEETDNDDVSSVLLAMDSESYRGSEADSEDADLTLSLEIQLARLQSLDEELKAGDSRQLEPAIEDAIEVLQTQVRRLGDE